VTETEVAMTDSEQMPIWEVDLVVDGPVSLERRFSTTQPKGLRIDDPFYSSVEIKPRPTGGFSSTLTARASNSESAKRAAMTFFGHMLDALVFKLNEPLVVSTVEQERRIRTRHEVRRQIDREDFIIAFADARKFREGDDYRVFLRALGWYRKGLYSEDSLDAYLACWNSLELVASNYYKDHPDIDTNRAKKGSESQIWECFKAIWGKCEKWPVNKNEKTWISDGNNMRVSIAHATEQITPPFVEQVDSKLPNLKGTTYRFLVDWYEWMETQDPMSKK
jgi:hypothetical protein